MNGSKLLNFDNEDMPKIVRILKEHDVNPDDLKTMVATIESANLRNKVCSPHARIAACIVSLTS